VSEIVSAIVFTPLTLNLKNKTVNAMLVKNATQITN